MVEFIEDGHIYLVDGVVVPSVSEILHFIFPNKYSNIPENILNAKAEYGTKVHEAIEKLENNEELPKLNYLQEISLEQYKKLKENFKMEVLKQEMMIHYKDLYCGRFDMIANVNEKYSLCDIKTTAKLDLESLSWQLSFYALAYDEEHYEDKFEKFYAIWLPKKDLGDLVEVKRKSKEELLKKLEEFYENDSKD